MWPSPHKHTEAVTIVPIAEPVNNKHNPVTINHTPATRTHSIGTSGNRGSRGEDPHKPALRKRRLCPEVRVQRARVSPAQKAGIRHMKQEKLGQAGPILKNVGLATPWKLATSVVSSSLTTNMHSMTIKRSGIIMANGNVPAQNAGHTVPCTGMGYTTEM